jgi:hypothetical protein
MIRQVCECRFNGFSTLSGRNAFEFNGLVWQANQETVERFTNRAGRYAPG